MNVENIEVSGFKGAFRGMRNPLNSWSKSDSCDLDKIERDQISFDDEKCGYHLGKNDLNLAQRLIKAGSSDCKFLRQININCDITAPLYWWKEMDQYKVGTVTNSTSTMHKLASTPITRDCFEMNDFSDVMGFRAKSIHVSDFWSELIIVCENLRKKYLETKDKKYWKELIRLLPESWLQTRTWSANYMVLRSIYFQRRYHKLNEWRDFCKWIQKLPYSNYLICYDPKGEGLTNEF